MLELVEILGIVRVSKIEIVGQGQRLRAGHGQVSRAFRHGNQRTALRLERDIVGVAIDRSGQVLPGRLTRGHANDRGIASRRRHRAHLHHVIVLAIDPALGTEIGRGEQPGQGRRDIRAGHLVQIQLVQPVERGGTTGRSLVEGRFVGELLGGNLRHGHAVIPDPHHAVVGHVADLRAGQIPLLEDIFHHLFLPGAYDDQHPLLRFREHDLIRGHARFALGHPGQVDLDPATAAAGRFASGAGQAGRAHVLHAHHRLRVLEKFQAGLQQQLLNEGIADLDGWAVDLGVLGQVA